MARLFRTAVAAGAVAGAALGIAAVGEYEASVPERAPAVQTSSAEYHFWEDTAPEVGAAVYGGLLGAVLLAGAAAVGSRVARHEGQVSEL